MASLDAKITWDLSDFDRLRRNIPSVSLVIKDALDEWADRVLEESKKLVPVKTGELQKSGEVIKTAIIGNMTPSVEIAYTADYALTIHEDLTLEHPNGGQAKYLEQPMLEHQDEIVQAVERRIYELLMGKNG
jgi:hypothetical protein